MNWSSPNLTGEAHVESREQVRISEYHRTIPKQRAKKRLPATISAPPLEGSIFTCEMGLQRKRLAGTVVLFTNSLVLEAEA